MAHDGNNSAVRSLNSTASNRCFLRGIYNFLSKYLGWMTVIAVGAAVVFDFIPYPYVHPVIETIFAYKDITPLLSTTLVIWAFSTSLIVFFIGKMGDRCFGIRFFDVLLAHESKQQILFKAILLFFEIFLLAFFATYNFQISFTVLCALQLPNVCYIFLLVIWGISKEEVVFRVQEQSKAIFQGMAEQTSDMQEIRSQFYSECPTWLLIKLLRGIDYSSREEMTYLQRCLPADSWEFIKNNPDGQLIISYELSRYLISCSGCVTEIPFALREFLMRLLASDEISNNGDIECPSFVKKGILAALLVEECSVELIQDLISCIPEEQYPEITGWCRAFLEKLLVSFAYGWKRTLFRFFYKRALAVEERDQLESFIRCLEGRGTRGEAAIPNV